MHVAHIIDTLQWGGAQKLLLTYVAEARRRGETVTIISLDAQLENPAVRQQLSERGATVECLPAQKMFSPLRFVRLWRLLRRQRFSMVQTHLTYANVVGTLAARLSGTPCVGTLHLAGFDPMMQPRKQRLENRVLRRWSGALIAVGYGVAEAYAALLAPRTIEIVPNAVEPVPPLEPAERVRLREELGATTDGPLVISVARLTKMKAFPDLVAAWAIVAARLPEARLAIVGSGDQEAPIREAIASRGLVNHIRLLGARNDVPQLLRSADMFASASHLEGLPVAVLEALAAGLPVVATAVGDVPHVVTPAVGRVVRPEAPQLLADALIELLEQPQLRAEAAAAAIARAASEYAPAAWFERLKAVYEQVIQEKRR